MKCLVLISFVLAGILLVCGNDERRQKVREAHDKCQLHTESQLPEDVLTKMKNHEKIDPLPETWGAHNLCMTKQLGMMDDDGKLLKEKIEKDIREQGADEAKKTEMLACIVDKGTPTETATHIMKCFAKQGHHEH